MPVIFPLIWAKIEFSLFLIGQVLSIPCYIFMFYNILFDKTARQSLHNHSILILLFYNFLHITIDLSLTQNYTRLGYVSPFIPLICRLWKFINYGIWYGGVFLMLWLSFERHILVFYPNLVRTTRNRLLFHYIPLIISSLYVPILYFYIIFLHKCEQIYLENEIRCGSSCFYDDTPHWFNLYDSFINYIIPILLIVLFSFTLVIRFIKQKRRLKRGVTWRQCRKMVLQLILVSTTHFIFDLPYIIIYIIQLSGYPTFGSQILSPYIIRLTFVPGLILPYATLIALPGLKKKIFMLYFWKKNRQTIIPTSIKN